VYANFDHIKFQNESPLRKLKYELEEFKGIAQNIASRIMDQLQKPNFINTE
jgi:hypothetical protein